MTTFVIIGAAAVIIPALELLAIWIFFRRYERRITLARRLFEGGP